MVNEGAPRAEPRVWLVLGDKLGDNAQVQAIADATGLAHERRRLVMRPEFEKGKPRFVADLSHLDLAASDALEPPWPDLVMTSGRRSAMAALWIKEQAGHDEQGRHRTCIVLVGRPRGDQALFDLVIAPPPIEVAEAPNVVRLELPLMQADTAKLEAAAEAWRSSLEAMPRPLTAVCVGGATKPFRFAAAQARDLVRRLNELQARDGGSFYLTTSRRTGAQVADVLERGLPEGTRLFRWDRDPPSSNPYHALLALADRFVVTGDSTSMQVEALRERKPLAIVELPQGMTGTASLGGLARKLGLRPASRDFGTFHERLYQMGLAVPLGRPWPQGAPELPDDLGRAAARVKALALEAS